MRRAWSPPTASRSSVPSGRSRTSFRRRGRWPAPIPSAWRCRALGDGRCSASALRSPRAKLVLEPGADREEARRRLLALPGIGPWTADYVMMRALGDADALPATDLGLRRALERLGEDASPAALLRRAEGWRPYRAYGAQYLWSVLEAEAQPSSWRNAQRTSSIVSSAARQASSFIRAAWGERKPAGMIPVSRRSRSEPR